MSGRTAPSAAPVNSAAPATPEVLAGVLAPADQVKALRAQLAAATAAAKAAKAAERAAKAATVAAPTARDYVRKVDAAILRAVGDLVTEAEVPEALLAEVRQLLANQLHHLSSPERGWECDLPKPARSEWK